MTGRSHACGLSEHREGAIKVVTEIGPGGQGFRFCSLHGRPPPRGRLIPVHPIHNPLALRDTLQPTKPTHAKLIPLLLAPTFRFCFSPDIIFQANAHGERLTDRRGRAIRSAVLFGNDSAPVVLRSALMPHAR